MHPTPTWAVYRDLKTGQLVRKYIASTGTGLSKIQLTDPKVRAKP